jgi:hypothetical protein
MEYGKLNKAYHNMHNRCYGNDPKAKYYKGKGICVCQEWHSWSVFREWALSNGYQEGIGLSLDRILPWEDYFPENCRWIPFSENRMRRDTSLMADPIARFDRYLKSCNYHRPWEDVPLHVWQYYILPGRKTRGRQNSKSMIRL